MNAFDLLRGKVVTVMTDAKVEVDLTITKVEEKVEEKTIQITPDTPANDWWGETATSRNVYFMVTFTNGFTKKYETLTELEVRYE